MSKEFYLSGCIIKGKDLYDLILNKHGILIYQGNTLTFVDVENMRTKRFEECNPAFIGKVIFTSNEFGFKYLLDPSSNYELVFDGDFLVFRTVDGRVDLVIQGMRL